MTYSTIESNGRVSRKTLSTQIDRLDGILDGLSEALSESVAMAVKEAVSSVVREAVEAAVKEVLSSPDLLKVALAHHTQPAAQTQPATLKVKGRTLWEALGATWTWLREKATEKAGEVKKSLGVAWTWCLEKLGQGCNWMNSRWNGFAAGCLSLGSNLVAMGQGLWQFRQTCSIALSVGLISGVASYLAGPMICAILCGMGGAALSLAGMILLPMWQLLLADNNEA